MLKEKIKKILKKVVKIIVVGGLIVIQAMGFSIKTFASEIEPYQLSEECITYWDDKTVFISAGHMGTQQGLDCGAIALDGRAEADMNLKLAKEIGKELEKKGIKVKYNRTGDKYESLKQARDTANNSGADYALFIHYNSSTNKKAQGHEVYYNTAVYDKNGQVINKKIANEINDAIGESLGNSNRGVFPSKFYNKNVNIKGCLLETAFITNEEELNRIDKNHNKLAKNIAEAIYDNLE